jgi:8-oxo-dGTP diphosphatase
MNTRELARQYHDRTLRLVEAKQLASYEYEAQEIPRAAMMEHLKWMCMEIMTGRVRGNKASRWIGYIQGELRAHGKFNINQLRTQTRECRGQQYCCGFAHFGDTVALILKAKPAWQAGKLNGVGGSVEEGETPAQAMTREWREETGTEVDNWGHFITLNTKGAEVHFFRARLNHSPVLVSQPEEPMRWYMVDHLPENVIPNLRWLVPMSRGSELFEEIEESWT